MARNPLGRGLGALLSDSRPPLPEPGTEIDLRLLDSNNLQPRSNFDQKRLQELAQSIRENGIVQPLIVRKSEGGRYEVVAGERRWKAAALAGLTRVPVVVRDVADDKMLELALIENIQRQELNAMEEARAYQKLIDTLGLTQETIAQRVGRDRTVITNHLRLLRLPAQIQALVEQEKLSMGHARALLAATDPEVQIGVAAEIIEKGLSVRDVERLLKRPSAHAKSSTRQEHPRADPNVKAAESKLQRRFSTKVRIQPSRSGKGGKVEIEYYNDQDLQRIYELLMTAENR